MLKHSTYVAQDGAPKNEGDHDETDKQKPMPSILVLVERTTKPVGQAFHRRLSEPEAGRVEGRTLDFEILIAEIQGRAALDRVWIEIKADVA